MAELALAASIIQLADIGAKLSLNLFGLADSVRSAATEARMVATETSLFSHALRSLGTLIKKRLQKDKRLRRTARRLLKSCKYVVAELANLVGDLEAESSGLGRMVNGFKWTFKKAKVNFLRSSLESLKGTMLLFIVTIDLDHAGKSDSPNNDVPPLKDHVETMMRVTEVATAGLVHAAQECDTLDESTDTRQLTNGVDGSVTRTEASGDTGHSSDLTSALVAQANGATEPQVGELALRSTSSVIHFRSTTLDLEAQQDVYMFALEALHSGIQDDDGCRPTTERSENSAPGKPTNSTHRGTRTSHDRKGESSKSPETKPRLKTTNDHISPKDRHASMETNLRANANAEKVGSKRPDDDGLRPHRHREQRPFPSDQPDEGHREEGLLRAFRSMAKSRRTSTQESIELLGADGNVYKLPWDGVSTWQDMHMKLCDLYPDWHPLGAAVRRRWYYLQDSAGYIFGGHDEHNTRLWSKLLQPNMTFRMFVVKPPDLRNKKTDGTGASPPPAINKKHWDGPLPPIIIGERRDDGARSTIIIGKDAQEPIIIREGPSEGSPAAMSKE